MNAINEYQEPAKNVFQTYPHKAVDNLDRLMFKGTKYENMDFYREVEWEDFKGDGELSTPVFVFDNGDRVAFDKKKNLIIL